MIAATTTMPTKIFVGNIAVDTSRDSMLQLFQRYGCVTECDVLGNYGFVVSYIFCLCENFIIYNKVNTWGHIFSQIRLSVYVQCALLPSHNRFATFRVTWIGASVFVCPSIVRLIEHISELFKCTFFNAVFSFCHRLLSLWCLILEWCWVSC